MVARPRTSPDRGRVGGGRPRRTHLRVTLAAVLGWGPVSGGIPATTLDLVEDRLRRHGPDGYLVWERHVAAAE